MYKDNKFYCNKCQKEINTFEKCWTKWSFPPSVHSFQDKPIKTLEYENAPILCVACAEKIMNEAF